MEKTKITRDDARRAKTKAKDIFPNSPIAISREDEEYCLKLNLPDNIDGVSIKVDFVGQVKILTLKEKLAKITRLEDKYNIRGVGIKISPGEMITTEESVDYIINFIEKAIESIQSGK